jgi:FtsH-binding integral membrane protein
VTVRHFKAFTSSEVIMNDPFFRADAGAVSGSFSYDMGLRAHMQKVFGYMAGGLALTGLIAYLVGSTALANVVFGTPLRWVAMLAPLAFMFFMNFRVQSLGVGTLQTLFWLFCGSMGLSMGAIFLIYTGQSIVQTFFVTAATFGAMALWGATTKRDLTGFGAFLLMGVMGLMIASIINLFMGSAMIQWVMSVIGVGVFTGLTAYDVQRIQRTYAESWGTVANEKLAIFNALALYMNFINAFQFLLSLIGDRR